MDIFFVFPFIFFIIFSIIAITVAVNTLKSSKINKKFINTAQVNEDEINLVETIKKNIDKNLNPQKYVSHCEYCGSELKDNQTKCNSCGATNKRK